MVFQLGDKPVLVGEANPYGGDETYALWPEPRNSAGGRLCLKLLQMDEETYLESFHRVNLCPQQWSAPLARLRAQSLIADRGATRLVLFGAKVCSAFRIEYKPFHLHQYAGIVSGVDYGQGVEMLVCPHPSGRNRVWGDPEAMGRARAALQHYGFAPRA